MMEFDRSSRAAASAALERQIRVAECPARARREASSSPSKRGVSVWVWIRQAPEARSEREQALHRARQRLEVPEALSQDTLQDRAVDRPVVVDRDVAKSDHRL